VESLFASDRVTFDVLRARLIRQVRLRINNGEFTERGLARMLGISQSQTHNVLKGARRLQMHLADRILTKLGLSAMDLMNEGELDAALRRKMADWDKEMEAIPEEDIAKTELALDELFAVKRPAKRSENSPGSGTRKAG
jgi:plasmid maintenance system antidote protein VapI